MSAPEGALGALTAAGPRAAGAPAEYALLVEAIREGYLLHYGEPRLVRTADPDLALLAGDYLYALGLERLARLGDVEAVLELADLISLSAQLHAGGGAEDLSDALWLSTAVAVGVGPHESHDEAKAAVRENRENAAGLLWDSARSRAAAAGLIEPLEWAAAQIGFAARG